MPQDPVTTEDQNACFEAWLRDHAAMLHHVANGFAAGADRHDLMQELLLALWRAVPAFRGDAKVSTYIYRVAHNAALTWKRAQRTYRAHVDRFEALSPLELSADDDAAPERALLEGLYARIRELPPLDRSLILLQLDGISYADIADMHGLTESNVGVRLNRLKQRLAQAMEGAPP